MKKRREKNLDNRPAMIISLIILALLVVGFFFFAKTSVAKTSNGIMGSAVVSDLAPMDLDDYFDSWNYRVTLIVKNPSNKTVNLNIGKMEVFVNELSLDAVKQVGEWHKTIPPKGQMVFQGDVKISPSTLNKIRAAGESLVEVRGDVSVSVEFLWMNDYRDQFWNLANKLKIY